MITPFKYALSNEYRKIERQLEIAVSLRFGLPSKLPLSIEKKIKRADRMAAWIEATQIAGFNHEEAAKIFIRPTGTPSNIRLQAYPPENAASLFLRRFAILGGHKGNKT